MSQERDNPVRQDGESESATGVAIKWGPKEPAQQEAQLWNSARAYDA